MDEQTDWAVVSSDAAAVEPTNWAACPYVSADLQEIPVYT